MHKGFFAMASGTRSVLAAAAAPPASRSRRGCSTILGARRSDDAPVNSTAQAMIGDMIKHVIASGSDNVAAKYAIFQMLCGEEKTALPAREGHAIEEA